MHYWFKDTIFSDFFLQSVILSLAKEIQDHGLVKEFVKAGDRFSVLQKFIFLAIFLNSVLDGNGPQSKKTLR